MCPENVQEESAAEASPAALQDRAHHAGGVNKQSRNILAFKFGGSSLLGAERMLHAAGLVRSAALSSSVTVVVSAMKGVTDHLLSIARALADGKLAHARREAELVLDLHLDVLHDLQLNEDVDRFAVTQDVDRPAVTQDNDRPAVTQDNDLRVRRELQLLG